MEPYSKEKLKIYLNGISHFKVKPGKKTTKTNSMNTSELGLNRSSQMKTRSFTNILKSYEDNIKSTSFKLLKNDEINKKQSDGDVINHKKRYTYNMSIINFNIFYRR